MHLRIRKRPVSFQFLVTCIFVPVVLAASLTTFVASFRIARNNQKETISESTATVLKLTTNYLNGRLNDVLALMMNVQNSPELQRVIRETDSNGSPSNEAIADYSGRKNYDVEYRLKVKSGEWRWFHAIGRLLRRDDGTPLSYVGMFVDVNDRKSQA